VLSGESAQKTLLHIFITATLGKWEYFPYDDETLRMECRFPFMDHCK
jgi:hypothetical protein